MAATESVVSEIAIFVSPTGNNEIIGSFGLSDNEIDLPGLQALEGLKAVMPSLRWTRCNPVRFRATLARMYTTTNITWLQQGGRRRQTPRDAGWSCSDGSVGRPGSARVC